MHDTHRWESDDRSLKAPSGISEMSLPWRDLRKGEVKKNKERMVQNIRSSSSLIIFLIQDRNLQQTQGLKSVERSHRYTAEAVVAQDSFHRE